MHINVYPGKKRTKGSPKTVLSGESGTKNMDSISITDKTFTINKSFSILFIEIS